MRNIILIISAALGLPSYVSAQKQTPPPSGTPKNIRLPIKRTFTLDNGMRVTLVPFGTVPKVALSLAIRAGSINETPDEVRLSSVVGDMLKEGTSTRTGEQIAQDAASMGGALSISVGSDFTTIDSEVLSEHAADMARLIADVAINPRLPSSELGRVKANQARQIAIDQTVPQSIANDRLQQTLYGAHPYGRTYPKQGMLEGFTIDQVRRFYADNFGAQRAHLIIVGVYDANAVERAIRQSFSTWARGSPPVSVDVPPGPTVRSLTLIDRTGAPQSTLDLAVRVPSPASTDYIPLRVTDYLLGGSFGSRITRNIREDKGYAYSPYSFTNDRQKSTYWAETADVTTKDTGASLKEIFAEIDKLQKEAPSAAELRGIQNQMTGRFALETSSRRGIISQLLFADLHGVGDAYLERYVKNVLAVTPEDVRRMAVTYLRPERMTLIVVGDKKTVETQLAPWTQ